MPEPCETYDLLRQQFGPRVWRVFGHMSERCETCGAEACVYLIGRSTLDNIRWFCLSCLFARRLEADALLRDGEQQARNAQQAVGR